MLVTHARIQPPDDKQEVQRMIQQTDMATTHGADQALPLSQCLHDTLMMSMSSHFLVQPIGS